MSPIIAYNKKRKTDLINPSDNIYKGRSKSELRSTGMNVALRSIVTFTSRESPEKK